MFKDIIGAIEIVNDLIYELQQDNLIVINSEMKDIKNKTINKQNQKTTVPKKGKNSKIKVSELKNIVQETISNLAKNTTGNHIDCGPVTICFVLKDAGDVSIFNVACPEWDPSDCS